MAVFRSTDGRFRAGWRILFFILLFWTFSAAIFAVKPLLGDMTKRAFLADYSLVIVAILAVAATVATGLARRWFDRRTFRSLGLERGDATQQLAFGFALSAAMAAVFLAITLAAGLVTFEGVQFDSSPDLTSLVSILASFSLLSLPLLLLEHILVGYWEELAFRGYLFQNMAEGLGVRTAVVVSCLLYGLLHASNPNATMLSSVIIVAFGFLRIYGYLVTGALWLSIGMHIGWNFFQGPVFGFAASGHEKASLLKLTVGKPEWLSGGAFGPEGSLLVLPVLVVAALAMRAFASRRS